MVGLGRRLIGSSNAFRHEALRRDRSPDKEEILGPLRAGADGRMPESLGVEHIVIESILEIGDNGPNLLARIHRRKIVSLGQCDADAPRGKAYRGYASSLRFFALLLLAMSPLDCKVRDNAAIVCRQHSHKRVDSALNRLESVESPESGS